MKLKPNLCDIVQGKVGPYKQYVVYEKRRVYVQYVVFYKSDRLVPRLPEVPKISKSRRHCGTKHQTPSAGHRRPSDEERDSGTDDSDEDDDDDDDSHVQWSAESRDCNVCPECSDGLSLTTATEDSSIKKVSVTRRNRPLLQACGQCFRLFTNYLLSVSK